MPRPAPLAANQAAKGATKFSTIDRKNEQFKIEISNIEIFELICPDGFYP
ncbi:MAG: hypothetical protein AAB724_02240 [Patescibacteria group bacterium]